MVKANYDYPVDSVLISPDLRVLGHVNANDHASTHLDGYLAFLRKGLALARGEAVTEDAPAAPSGVDSHAHVGAGDMSRAGMRALKLTPDQPHGSLLNVVRRGGLGESSMLYLTLDVSAFADGGEIEVSVTVGGSEASGKFELCVPQEGRADVVGPVETLASVGPGQTAVMSHEFAVGANFGLAVMPAAGCTEGQANAFLASVRVRAR